MTMITRTNLLLEIAKRNKFIIKRHKQSYFGILTRTNNFVNQIYQLLMYLFLISLNILQQARAISSGSG